MARTAARPQQHWTELYARCSDPQAALFRTATRPELLYRMHVGISSDDWVTSAAETNVLTLAPPRAAGKTSGIIIPGVLTCTGPAVVVSTKFTAAQATALARARLGTLWHYGPSGTPCPPGFTELRWSPIVGAEDWEMAWRIANRIIRAAEDRGSHAENKEFWQALSTTLLAVLLHWAALKHKTMDWVVKTVIKADFKHEIVPLLGEMDGTPGFENAAVEFHGIVNADERLRSNAFVSANVALRAYKFPGAMRSTLSSNFSPAKFVRGEPDEPNPDLESTDFTIPQLPFGRYDTIYITAPAEDQEMVKPVIVGFLTAIASATYKMADEDVHSGHQGRRPVVFYLDEMFGMAPLPDLPIMLGEGGSQRLQIVGALQDLSQAQHRWGKELGDGFITLFQNVVVMPGVRHEATLRLLSLVAGEFDRAIVGLTSGSDDRGGHSSNIQHSQDRIQLLPEAFISRGHADDPDLVLHFAHGGAWHWIYNTPYYRTTPWAQLLVGTMAWAAERRPTGFPIPDLDRDGSGKFLLEAGGPALRERYTQASARLRREM